jgi:hypothetical protein
MGGKILILLRRFLSLLWRWGWQWAWFGLSWLALVLFGMGCVICGRAGVDVS